MSGFFNFLNLWLFKLNLLYFPEIPSDKLFNIGLFLDLNNIRFYDSKLNISFLAVFEFKSENWVWSDYLYLFWVVNFRDFGSYGCLEDTNCDCRVVPSFVKAKFLLDTEFRALEVMGRFF